MLCQLSNQTAGLSISLPHTCLVPLFQGMGKEKCKMESVRIAYIHFVKHVDIQ